MDVDTQFRITVWPEGPLKVPGVERRASVHADDGGWLHPHGWSQPEPLRDEVVLRDLLDVDLTSVDELIAFTAEHGLFTRSSLEVLSEGIQPDMRVGGLLHVGEVAVYLRRMRGAVLHWLALVDGAPLMSAWEAAGIADPERRIPRRDVEDDTAWSWFVGTMNAGLEGLPPHVMAWSTSVRESGRLEYGEPRVDLFTAMCVQLFNLIVDDLPALRCANETCGRRFVRQAGRARKGQYRTEGVRFCSASCAKAQMQREYRRRKRSTS